MIRIIIALLIFFSVMAVSPLLIDEKGYILIAMGNTTIELTVLSASIMLTLLFIALVISLKLLRGGVNISFGTWNKLAFAGQRRGIANFNKGLAAYMLEDYSQAEALFAKSAIPSKRKQSAYLLAASASAKLNLNSNTNHYLELLEQETLKLKDLGLEGVIVNIKLLMNQKKPEADTKARALIDENHKQIGHDARLLALEIDLCLVEKRFNKAIQYLVWARKEKTITEERIQAWERIAYYGSFNESINDKNNEALQHNWQSLGRKIKQRDTVILAYCQVLAENDLHEPLNKLLSPLFKKSPSTEFLKQVRNLPIKRADELIAIAQQQLHKNIHSAKWLSCLGHLALKSQQYSMAEKAFGSLIKLEDKDTGRQYDRQDLQALAQAHSKEKQYQAADAMWSKAHTL
ncbi:heme biosynthesis HemY N-terminal domain-containing protein [Colwellia ponticola]|uniref:Heme biosynthesis protein HemY n=1 Tax=Colwellia ponticola TaxID=2304625 RepID=A0A8H2JLK1_9GAMM|nr:heme biosynthesis HemY N-terminal domain-containing protein [Colwellia ponticola]TMM45773.1 heme biosynthesis protein HemY [Colwellia ponticola]